MPQNPAPRRTKWIVLALVCGGVLLFAGANAHLLWLSLRSHPGCVAHVKVAGEGAGYIAAKSAC